MPVAKYITFVEGEAADVPEQDLENVFNGFFNC